MRALLFMLLCCSLPADAARVTFEQARLILGVAYGQFHGPRELFEDGPPPVFTVSQAELQAEAKCTHCPLLHGTYNEDTGKVHVWDQLDFSQPYAPTVLAHEFIHYFQTRTKGRVSEMNASEYERCLEVMERESQAYLIQMHLLMKAGDYMMAQVVRSTANRQASPMRCKP